MARPKSTNTSKIAAPDVVAQQEADFIAKSRAHKRGAANAAKAHKQGLQEKVKKHEAGLPKAGGFGEQATKLTRPGDTGGHFGKMPKKSKPKGLDGQPLKTGEPPKDVGKLKGVLTSDGTDAMNLVQSMNEDIVNSLLMLDARVDVNEEDIEEIFRILEGLEDEVEEFISDEEPRDLDPPEETVTAGLNAFYFNCSKQAVLTMRINRLSLRIGTNMWDWNEMGGTTGSYGGFIDKVIVPDVGAEAGEYYLYFQLYYASGYQFSVEHSKTKPDQSDENVLGTDYPAWREELCLFTIESDGAGGWQIQDDSVTQIWPGQTMAVNDRVT